MALDQVDIDNYEVKEDGQVVPKGEKEMSFLDHLEELRWHIIYSLIAVVVIGIGVFLARDFVFDTLIMGPKHSTFLSYVVACQFSEFIGFGDKMCIQPVEFEVIVTEMGELFLTHIKVSMILGLILSFPFIFWQFWKFIKPGLHEHEQGAIQGVVLVCSLLFFTGVSFGYFVISPFAVNFLVGYRIADIAPQVRLTSLVNYMVMFTAPAGLIFELPVVVYFLAKVGLLTPQFMRQYRRHAIIGILAISALITPPDVVTQFLIGIPLYFLYEISISVASRMSKKYEASLMNNE
jgi:sec-independent protein translocase protein TatC